MAIVDPRSEMIEFNEKDIRIMQLIPSNKNHIANLNCLRTQCTHQTLMKFIQIANTFRRGRPMHITLDGVYV